MPDYKKRQTGESNLTITPAQKVTEVLAVLVILYIVYIFITNDIASETKTDENYGEPKSIIATEKQKIEIIPSVGPTMVSRIPYGKQYAFALIYNNETFECHCTPSIWCNDKAVKKGKFYLKSVTIRIANGRIKQKAVKGYRYCRVTAWEYLESDDEKFFSQFKQEQGVTYTW